MATTQYEGRQVTQTMPISQGFRPINFAVSKSDEILRSANGHRIRVERDARRREELEKQDLERKAFDGDALEKDEIDGEEIGTIGLKGKSGGKNVPIKSEIARLRRAVDRGERLSASDMDKLDGMKIPEAKDLMKVNRERMDDSKGFTLSPMKALFRGL